MGSNADGIEERITQLRRRDRRYSRNGYFFVLDALDYTIESLGRDCDVDEARHIGGKELLVGVQELAAEQFGPMASVCFRSRMTPSAGRVARLIVVSLPPV